MSDSPLEQSANIVKQYIRYGKAVIEELCTEETFAKTVVAVDSKFQAQMAIEVAKMIQIEDNLELEE